MNYLKDVLVGVILFFLFSIASAQVPQTMSYQGTLTDDTGQPVANGDYAMTFRIYTVSSGGTAIWEESQNVPVSDGIFNAVLGSSNPLDIPFDENYWLGVTIDDGSELDPRIELTSSAYSLNAQHVSGTSNIFPGDGNVGIGTTDPQASLDVRGRHFRIGSAAYSNGETSGEAIISSDGVNTDLFPATDDLGNIRIRDGNGSGALVLNNWATSNISSYSNIDESTPSDLVLQSNGGDVGIGIEYPDEKLHVDGVIYSSTGGFRFPDGSIQTTASAGGGEADNLGNHIATQNITLNEHWLSGDGDNEGVYIDEYGNVGVGTDSAHSKFEVDGRLLINGQNGFNQHDRAKLYFYGANLGHSLGTEDFHNTYGPDQQYANTVGHKFYIHGDELAAQIGFGGWGTPTNRANSIFYGDVGIGISNPAARLEVAGYPAGTNEHVGIRITNLRSSLGLYWELRGYDSGAGGPYGRFSIFGGVAGGADRFVVTTIGNVGIGTIDPVARLEVNGVGASNGIQASSNAGGGYSAGHFTATGSGTYAIWAQSNDYDAIYATSASSSHAAIRAVSAGPDGDAIYADGNISYTGELIHVVDNKFLSNIQPMDDALTQITNLKVRAYQFTADPQYSEMNFPAGTKYGFVSQELKNVLPELVSKNVLQSAEETIEYEGVNYIELIPILVKAMQEQQETIEQLQAQIQTLQNK